MPKIVLALLVGCAVTTVAVFSTTIYLHRCKTHRALKLHPALDWFFKFLVWITTGQSVKEWVAVHRKHHAYSDEVGDPHSPAIHGFWTVQLLNFRLYMKEAKDQAMVYRFAGDITENRLDRVLFNHGLLGLASGIAGLVWLLGPLYGLIAALTHALLYVGVLTSCVNAIGHHRIPTAYQNYTEDYAAKTYNYGWLSWITAGEGRHNNHHGDPKSAKFSHFPGETDPAWVLIKLLGALGLAREIQLPRVCRQENV